jgi:hypothetical protein
LFAVDVWVLLVLRGSKANLSKNIPPKRIPLLKEMAAGRVSSPKGMEHFG